MREQKAVLGLELAYRAVGLSQCRANALSLIHDDQIPRNGGQQAAVLTEGIIRRQHYVCLECLQQNSPLLTSQALQICSNGPSAVLLRPVPLTLDTKNCNSSEGDTAAHLLWKPILDIEGGSAVHASGGEPQLVVVDHGA